MMSSDSNSEDTTKVSRHPKYYFDDSDPECRVFLVEKTLYRLSTGILRRHSQLFARVSKVIEECDAEQGEKLGENDDNPIEIPHLLSSTFDLFVEHHVGFPRAGYRYTKRGLVSFLRFCDMYECNRTKEFVVDQIKETSWQFHPAELMNLAITSRIPSLFRMAFRSLTDIPMTHFTQVHHEMVGLDVFRYLVSTKSRLDTHLQTVAAEEPPIDTHAVGCEDTEACEEDWHEAWWNGMGRYLLDVRNSQPYGEAIKRFEKEMELGRMGEGCKKRMLKQLDAGLASRFKSCDELIDRVCDRLIKRLHL